MRACNIALVPRFLYIPYLYASAELNSHMALLDTRRANVIQMLSPLTRAMGRFCRMARIKRYVRIGSAIYLGKVTTSHLRM